MMRLMLGSPCARLMAVAVISAVSVVGCTHGSNPGVARYDSPVQSTSPRPTHTPAATVEAFFAALRRGSSGEAEQYVANGALPRAALDDLARLGMAVTATISGDGPTIQVLLRSQQPMQYWPQCPFSLTLTDDRQQITGETSCSLPLGPSAS
jgi:hypothetical protein